MTTLQEAAMRKALEALETCSYGDYSAKHVVDPSFDGDAVEAAIESLNAALAQQGQEPEIAMIDAAMVEMANIHPPLKRSECQRLIRAALSAAPAPQAQEPVLGTKTWFDGEKLITQNLTASDIYAEPAPVDREMCMARENAVLRVALREVQDASNWAYGAIADKLGEAK